MADKQENERRAIEVLTGATAEVSDAFNGHDENLSPKGARDIVNVLKLADLMIVPAA